ncbi:MAG: hypothetical protein J6C79_00165 [Clostridia bacterium]|nr:hypothetical protein [Clostridia bacterium]
MTVKECVELAAMQLGIAEDVQAFLSGSGSEEDGKKAALLLSCFNIVENELALDYFPLLAEDTLETSGGVVEFSALQNAAVRVTRVADEWGNSTAFQLFPSFLKTQPGKVCVTYTYTPEKKTMDGVSDFCHSVSARLIAYGMAAEYTMATGAFEDAAVWDKKYKDGIRAAYRLQKCERIRSRRWV